MGAGLVGRGVLGFGLSPAESGFVLTSLTRRCRPHGPGKRAALTPDVVAIVTAGITDTRSSSCADHQRARDCLGPRKCSYELANKPPEQRRDTAFYTNHGTDVMFLVARSSPYLRVTLSVRLRGTPIHPSAPKPSLRHRRRGAAAAISRCDYLWGQTQQRVPEGQVR
jgi:hypothetical protein